MMLISNYLATKKEASVTGGLSCAGSNLPLSDTGTNATTTTKICQESVLWRRVRGSNPDPCGSISVSDSPRNRAGSPSNHEISITKKTDGRLRECLSTLVGAQSRSVNGYYQQVTKKSRKNT